MSALLHIKNFAAAYGEVPVVSNVMLDLKAGEIMALTGRNGMGKTTLLRGIMGLTPVRQGTVHFAENDIAAQATEVISRAGLAYGPKILLVDEATEGLAPLVAREIWRTLSEIAKTGMSAIIVDRDLKRLARIVSSVTVMFRGEIAFAGTPEALLSDDALVRKYIGL